MGVALLFGIRLPAPWCHVAGVVEPVTGRNGGYRLARPAGEITMLDVVLAVNGDEPAFRCSEIRQRGPSAIAPERYVQPCGIARAM